jgi:hypothetical protein
MQGHQSVFLLPADSRLRACQLWMCAGSQGDFDSSILRLSYTSLTTPSTTMDHNLATHNRQGSRAPLAMYPKIVLFSALFNILWECKAVDTCNHTLERAGWSKRCSLCWVVSAGDALQRLKIGTWDSAFFMGSHAEMT